MRQQIAIVEAVDAAARRGERDAQFRPRRRDADGTDVPLHVARKMEDVAVPSVADFQVGQVASIAPGRDTAQKEPPVEYVELEPILRMPGIPSPAADDPVADMIDVTSRSAFVGQRSIALFRLELCQRRLTRDAQTSRSIEGENQATLAPHDRDEPAGEAAERPLPFGSARPILRPRRVE